MLDALVSWWDGFFREPLRRVEREQREYLAGEAGRRFDWPVAAALITAAVALTLQEYVFASQAWLLRLTALFSPGASAGLKAMFESSDPSLRRFWSSTIWAIGQIVTYTLPPLIVWALFFRRPLADWGVKLRGAFAGWWVYVLMFAFMAPFIWLVSFSPAFLETYPFYKPSDGEPLWPRFIAWEAVYFLQFVALEFFFRGFLLHSLRRRLGVYSIFVMTIPYCMIHFGKPLPETLGAIGAGVVLGFMSLKTRSIWMGALLHIAVAGTMDWLALPRLR